MLPAEKPLIVNILLTANSSQTPALSDSLPLLQGQASGVQGGDSGGVLGRELRQPHEDELGHVLEALLGVSAEKLLK